MFTKENNATNCGHTFGHMNRLRFKTLLICYLFSIPLAHCASTPSGGSAFMLFTEEFEKDIGESAFKDYLSRVQLSGDTRMKEILVRVGNRIAKASPRPGYPWQFELISSSQVNAFSTSGGKVAFYEGIMKICQNEAGLATVMGHEVGHSVSRHMGQRLSQALSLTAVEIGVAVGVKDQSKRDAILAAVAIGGEFGIILPFSRIHEFEADNLGFQYMAKAGYDPDEAIAFWERFAAVTGGGNNLGEFFSTHPATLNRIKEMRSFLPWARKFYQAAPQKYGAGEMLY